MTPATVRPALERLPVALVVVRVGVACVLGPLVAGSLRLKGANLLLHLGFALEDAGFIRLHGEGRRRAAPIRRSVGGVKGRQREPAGRGAERWGRTGPGPCGISGGEQRRRSESGRDPE